ncbi:MAG: 4Fe-4S binding protein, partial [Desulfobacteraceae bacterium]|nr:4Fe-4S binding protein [Desulfobacteraceae bacterium]
PVDAVKLKDEKAVVDLDWCIGCGVCAVSCPTGAISLNRRIESGGPDTFADLHGRIRQERGLRL